MIIKDFIDSLALAGLVNSSDTCGALKIINAARRLVYPLGDWTGTIEYGCVNLDNGCFTLPYYLETVRDIWQCNSEIALGDEVWSNIGPSCLSDCCGAKAGVTRTDRSVAIPITFPIGSIIGLRPLDSNDAGKTIRVTIRNAAGSLDTDTIKLKNYNEIVFGELLMGKVVSISKEPTFGRIDVYYRDPKGVNCKVYSFAPDEVNPKYWVYKSTCQCGQAIVKAKKKIIPYTEKDIYDELDIQSTGGLEFAIQALSHQRSGNNGKFLEAMQVARSLMEKTKEDLKKTSEPAKAAVVQISHPQTNLTYGY